MTQQPITRCHLNDLAEMIHELAKLKGWYDNAETPEQFIARTTANMHGEVSELWEAFRAGRLNSPCDKSEKMEAEGLPVLSCIEEELADIIIRALDSSRRLNVDIGRAVMLKHRFNETRPYRHGGKAA